MKKISKLLFCVLCMSILPLIAKADMGTPELTEYKIVVNNPEGIDTYDYDGIVKGSLDVNSICTVYSEEYLDNEKYLKVYCEEDEEDDYKYYYYVKASEVVLLTKDFDYRKLQKEKAEKLYVFGDDCELYKGPSEMYGKIDGDSKIPAGTYLTYEYSDEMWAYVNYNGKSGFVYKYTYDLSEDYKRAKVAIVLEDKKMFINQDKIRLYENPFGEGKIENNLKFGEELKVNYIYYSTPKDYYVGFKYNGKIVWLEVYETINNEYNVVNGILSTNCTSLITLDNKVKVYDKIEGKEIKNITIPANTEFNVYYDEEIIDYSNGDSEYWYQIIYKDKKYWVNENDNNIAENHLGESIYKTNKDIDLYEFTNINSKIIGTIPAGKEIKGTYEYDIYSGTYWIYLTDGNISGWYRTNDDSKTLTYLKNSNNCLTLDNNKNQDNNKINKVDKKQNFFKSLSPKEIIIYSISGAVVLCLFAIVVIKLIKKKHNKIIESND